MSERQRTAQEIREIEPYAVIIKMTPYGPVKDTKRTEVLRSILCYAAEVVERCDTYIMAAKMCKDNPFAEMQKKICNYILRGDAGEGA